MRAKFNIRVLAVLLVFCLCGAGVVLSLGGNRLNADAAPNIVKGDTVANIKAVQTRLKALGYTVGAVDGIFGTKTRNAVRSFQRANKLVVDGIVGANTEKALGVTLKTSSGVRGFSSADVYLLARTIYAEARGEPYNGQVAVGAVVLNRVRNASFPNTIAGVVYQPYAFTAVNDGQINLAPNQTAMKAAMDAINGFDPTNGCLYYFNPAIATSKWIWNLKVVMKIGRHSFARGVY